MLLRTNIREYFRAKWKLNENDIAIFPFLTRAIFDLRQFTHDAGPTKILLSQSLNMLSFALTSISVLHNLHNFQNDLHENITNLEKKLWRIVTRQTKVKKLCFAFT